MALNVVCCETAIRLKLGPKRKWVTRPQNVADDPKRAYSACIGGRRIASFSRKTVERSFFRKPGLAQALETIIGEDRPCRSHLIVS